MIKGVIFDLDGVLVSTDEMHFEAWKMLAEELGIDKFTKEDNKRQKGVSRMESLEVVLSKGGRIYTATEKEEMAERKNNFYKELLAGLDENAILPGAVDCLKMLRSRGILIGIGSVSKNAPLILARTGLMEYVDKVSCGLDITRSKPDPEVFEVAANKLELKYEECLVVEDSLAGIVAGRAAHMKTLGVGTEYVQLRADYEAPGLNAHIDWETILEV
ncbi:beta-phosphoglucomutase [Anaerocolumna jejuensis DSM 15929]|uniref:Beta-phosphoglucomutase n=1 Tax=Anaerocolumna jejuensis DSM 15929 TaxID=1121322 RepID=A0A1M6MRL7_9FIRM|nr:beta-phosphoglucomutase [Anaerocolumna jejuensis]SHJ85923.1 beta-phosphoglucomutase [Anaerocolumna jejuensis DSM 15929]